MEKQVTTHRGGYLEALLNSCPEAILAINAEGIIRFANRKACELTECTLTELINKSIVELYENLETAREANRRIYQAGGTIHDMEVKTKTKSGKLILTRVSASHLHDSEGNYIGGVGYFARYRPWAGAEAEVKARVEKLEGELEKCKDMASPVFELYPGLSIMLVLGNSIVEHCEDISENLLGHVEKHRTRVIMFDLSASSTDSSEVARQLAKLIRTVRLLGAECIIADMHANLARAMEPLMVDLGNLRSYGNMEVALEQAFKILGYEIRQKA